MIAIFNEEKVRQITVVRGYKKETVNLPSVDYVDNDHYLMTGEAATLACADKHLKGVCLIAYGDILFRHYMLPQLIATKGDVVLAVDALWRERDPDPASHVRDLVQASQPFTTDYLQEDVVSLTKISHDLDAGDIHGEWIGLAKLSEQGAAQVKAILADMRADGSLDKADLGTMFSRLVANGTDVRVLYTTGRWLDIDDPTDLENAQRFL
jgi:phosphoenolpyruvate phosphomutase